MIILHSKLLLKLTFIYFVITPLVNCWGSATDIKEDSEIRNFPKKNFPADEISTKKIDFDEMLYPFRNNLISLREKTKESACMPPFKNRYQRKIPSLISLNVSSSSFSFSLTQDFSQLENMMQSLCNKTNYQTQCIFACSSKEIFSYQKLFKAKSWLSDTSKIIDIKKAMFFYKAPIVVALAISKEKQSILTKLLIIYEFNDGNLAFSAKDLLEKDKSSSFVLPYTILQLFAFEAWVFYNVNLINQCA